MSENSPDAQSPGSSEMSFLSFLPLTISSCILFSIAGSLNLHTVPHIKPPGCVIPSVRHVLHTSSPETTEIYCLPALLRAHFQTFWLRFNLLCVWSQPSQLWSLAYSSKGTLLRRCTGVWSYPSRDIVVRENLVSHMQLFIAALFIAD